LTDTQLFKDQQAHAHLKYLADAFIDICDDCYEDAFWLLYAYIKQNNISIECGKQFTREIEFMAILIRQSNEKLAAHIDSLGVNYQDCCQMWFASHFCSVLDVESLEGVYDIVNLPHTDYWWCAADTAVHWLICNNVV
jgi:Rab-GTPase-TBC domain